MHSRYRSRAGPRVLSIFTKLRYRAGSTGLGPRRRICSDQWFRGWSRAVVSWLIHATDDLRTCAVTGTVTDLTLFFNPLRIDVSFNKHFFLVLIEVGSCRGNYRSLELTTALNTLLFDLHRSTKNYNIRYHIHRISYMKCVCNIV